ncbi:MAG: ATP-dependent DNA helicase UvrD2 [Candidatus Nanopelagicales bacterium]
MDDPILSRLDGEQRAVVTAPAGPVVVSAGAGTGKTTAITHRIAYRSREGTLDPRQVLAVTFTNRAAAEMRDRLRLLGVDAVAARTFHAAALRQLRYFWPRQFSGSPYRVISSGRDLITQAARSTGITINAAVIRDLAAEIMFAKQYNVSPENYCDLAEEQQREIAVEASQVMRVYRLYETAKLDQQLIDFDDVLVLCAQMLNDNAGIAEEIRSTYRAFTVDEFQDVSPIQDRLLRLWLGEGEDICVVGDTAQTIYTFAGARDEYLRNFAKNFPATIKLSLVRNYRSLKPIVTVANRVLAAGDAAADKLVATRNVTDEDPPRLLQFDDEPAEAVGVAAEVVRVIAGGWSPRDIAVLVRTRGQLPALEQAFADAGVPLIVRGSERFFDRPEVREAITRLRGAARGQETFEGTTADQVSAILAVMGFTVQPPVGVGAIRQRWESLASLHALAESMDAGSVAESASLTGLVSELDRRAQAQHAPQADAVTLATIHAAKGLQWRLVVVAGLAEGVLPLSSWSADAADTAREQLNEERRLFYVAVTRAQDDLVLSWAQARTAGARTRAVSRFVAEALPASAVTAGGAPRSGTAAPGAGGRAGRSGGRRPPANCRTCTTALVTPAERARGRCRRCPSTADERLVEAIKGWRLQESKAREIPAYQILTDATVEALAEARPSTSAELLAISGIGNAKLTRYGKDILALIESSTRS